MSDENKDYVEIETAGFRDMDIGQLRQYASHLRLAIPKTAKKEDIIKMIDNKLQGNAAPVVATLAAGAVPPGHAKIKLLEDPTPDASNYPVPINANGYICYIPRGVEVIVPMRVVRVLNDAQVTRPRQQARTDEWGREVTHTVRVTVPSYPFQVLEMTPGPEALTPYEISKRKTSRPREKYAKKFGYYPRPGQLHKAIESGLITLESEDEISESEARAAELLAAAR